MRLGFLLVFLSVLSFGCRKHIVDPVNYVNDVDDETRMLLVLSAPSVDDIYYQSKFEDIVQFQIAYANAIIGNDNVVVLVDRKTRKYYEDALPGDVLLTQEVFDIWMRDFTTVNPLDPVKFKYTWASMTQEESEEVQQSFVDFSERCFLEWESTDLSIDGGNIVDNYAGRVITTTRFQSDNRITGDQAREELKAVLGATQVSVIEADEDVLGHADGMVMWADDNPLIVNDYSAYPNYRTGVINELKATFPGVNLIEIPVDYGLIDTADSSVKLVDSLLLLQQLAWDGFESACGVHVNSTVTFENIYVPTFDMDHDDAALQLIRDNTTKNVIEINASGVCEMGGSVRCLTWQQTGDNATRLIEEARIRK